MLAGILDVALRDRRMLSNPARGVKLPRKVAKSRAYLRHDQVVALARAASHPELVVFLEYTGLRWGEATGLRVKHVDARRRVHSDALRTAQMLSKCCHGEFSSNTESLRSQYFQGF